MTAPLLLIGIGNPARGDDGLGPALVDALRAEGWGDDGQVELLVEYQLQIEHALAIAGRRAVLFVDAAVPGSVVGGVALTPVQVQADAAPMSHALQPAAVLAVLQQALGQVPPPAHVLAIEGERFGLGEGLSPRAQTRLADALALARSWSAAVRLVA